MTEKRFTLAYEKGNWWAVRDGDITLWKEEVVDLLNALHEENIQLKSLNVEMEDYCARLKEKNLHLQKMNELLLAEVKWNKEQRLKSKDKTPRITPKEVRERIWND